ncbi:hypothetical protein LTV02_14530 [Nocardia yamanashiensis]|uniref:hypothetical protein n=1 Tax=Nocardia yamanashiensis TaxID=209247 RepID=UPI001E332124|nr:hypothetical protein [Nocardia yamanashiensis]UGT44526.1 hypothetical protein LTV02_14530 [Nocardia yamanashiensis]
MTACRVLIIAALAAIATAATTGCAHDDPAKSPATGRLSMSDLLLTSEEIPGIVFTLPWGADAARQSAISVRFAGETPQCRTRDSATTLVTDDTSAGTIQQLESADGVPRHDVRLAVLDHTVDPAAMSATIRACPAWSRISTYPFDGTPPVSFGGESPSTADIPGIGPVIELAVVRDGASTPANGFFPTATLVRFVTVGDRTVVEYLDADRSTLRIPVETRAFGDRLLRAQVDKVRSAQP